VKVKVKNAQFIENSEPAGADEAGRRGADSFSA
jgi:hypothetical protein